jgi:hypothetical protein
MQLGAELPVVGHCRTGESSSSSGAEHDKQMQVKTLNKGCSKDSRLEGSCLVIGHISSCVSSARSVWQPQQLQQGLCKLSCWLSSLAHDTNAQIPSMCCTAKAHTRKLNQQRNAAATPDTHQQTEAALCITCTARYQLHLLHNICTYIAS